LIFEVKVRKGNTVDVQLAKDLYEEGLSINEIGRRLGHHHSVIAYHIHRSDLPIRTQAESQTKPIDTSYLIELYQKGYSLVDISKTVNLSPEGVRGRLIKSSVKIRTTSEGRKLAISAGKIRVRKGKSHPNWKGRYTELDCAQCGRLFRDYVGNHRKYCCRRCYELSKKGTKLSEDIINKMKGRTPWNKGRRNPYQLEVLLKMRQAHLGRSPVNKGVRMGPELRDKISRATKGIKKPAISEIMKQLTGPRAHGWKGGRTAANKLIRNSKLFAIWREAVFQRDDYTCQICGERGRYLRAHHIMSFAEHEELRFDISNGVTLCLQCHSEVHHRTIVSRWTPIKT